MIDSLVTLWIATRCLAHPRLAGAGMTLLRDFNDWSKSVVLTRGAFQELLEKQGFSQVEVKGEWLVMGLALKPDAEVTGVGVPPMEGEAAVVDSGARPEVE